MAAALTRLDDGCRGAGPMFKPKRLAPIVKALEVTVHAGNEIPREYAEASLKALREGAKENEGSATNVRVVVDLSSRPMAPVFGPATKTSAVGYWRSGRKAAVRPPPAACL